MIVFKRLAFTFLCYFTLVTFAYSSDKGFKALSEKKYDKAYSLFAEALQKRPDDVQASFGMSKLLSSRESKYFDIEKAYVHIINAREGYKQLDEKSKSKLVKNEVDENAISSLLSVIDAVAFQKALTANSLEVLDEFIKIHKTSPDLEKAINLKSQLDFLNVQTSNTYQAYADYMKKYPKSVKIAEAKKKYDLLLYQAVTADGSLEAFKNFVQNYPDSPYRKEALAKLEVLEFKSQLKENSIAGYEEFIRNNPDSKFKKMAEDSIYARYTSFPSIEEYEKYIKKYPQSRHIRDAWEKLYVLFNDSGTPESYEAFKARYPQYIEPYQLENDIELANFGAKMLNTNFAGFKPDQAEAYITLAAPTEQAIAMLKLRIKPYIQAHQYQKAIDVLQKIQPYFQHKAYRISSWIETLNRAKESYLAKETVAEINLN
ncbi:hypothetical protein [Adhaeribacter aquaticus]|uniref:hypothetical protein n=1 Tax=Adhaeribacter aquaticus TaxID=299567 RepID=UPI0003F7AA2A|nr:hypothetical protein [Adhaeribacter aquaticus]